jgi:hypothetical protein
MSQLKGGQVRTQRSQRLQTDNQKKNTHLILFIWSYPAKTPLHKPGKWLDYMDECISYVCLWVGGLNWFSALLILCTMKDFSALSSDFESVISRVQQSVCKKCQIYSAPIPCAFAMWLCARSHQEVQSTFPLLDSGVDLLWQVAYCSSDNLKHSSKIRPQKALGISLLVQRPVRG